MLRVPFPTGKPSMFYSQAFVCSMLKSVVFSLLSFLGFPLHAWGCFAFFVLHTYGISTLLVLSLSLVTCCSTAYALISHVMRGGGAWRGGGGRRWEGDEGRRDREERMREGRTAACLAVQMHHL